MLEVAKEMGVDPKAYTYDNTPEGWLIMQANMDYEKIQAGNDMYDCLRYDYPMTPGTKTWAATAQFMGQYNEQPIQGVAANSVLPLINQDVYKRQDPGRSDAAPNPVREQTVSGTDPQYAW